MTWKRCRTSCPTSLPRQDITIVMITIVISCITFTCPAQKMLELHGDTRVPLESFVKQLVVQERCFVVDSLSTLQHLSCLH